MPQNQLWLRKPALAGEPPPKCPRKRTLLSERIVHWDMRLRVALTLVLCLVGSVVCFAQNSQIGTWKLDEAKSKVSRRGPKDTKVIYEAVGDAVKVTMDGIGSDG